jgi:D-tyrosyl-tRNA(Tyr) deacylase
VRAVVQRAVRAAVRVDDELAGGLNRPGLCVLLAVTHSDDASVARAMAAKLYGLRILEGDRSCAEIGAPLLVVSQFTLYGDVRRGRRPSWSAAAPPGQAEPLFEAVVAALRGLGATVTTGRFGARMAVELVNDGPVTLIVDVPPVGPGRPG